MLEQDKGGEIGKETECTFDLSLSRHGVKMEVFAFFENRVKRRWKLKSSSVGHAKRLPELREDGEAIKNAFT